MSRRMRFVLVVLIGTCSAAALAGCAQRTLPPVAVTTADSGSAQTLSAGQELVISLDSNPTTGYRWAVDGAVPAQLKQVGEPKYASSSNAIGSCGTEVWTFAGQGTGDGTLKLKYWRSFEPTATPADTFVVKVSVR